MARIAVDMDEVLADTLPAHLARYNRHYHAALTLDDLRGRWLWDAVPDAHHDDLIAWLNEPDFFADLERMPHAVRVLEKLSDEHEVFVASAAMEVPGSFLAKYTWMQRYFPFIPHSHIVFCGDKSILRADYLIDDNPRQLRLFTGAQANDEDAGTGLLFSAPHNCRVDAASFGWTRVEDWLAVEQYFLSK